MAAGAFCVSRLYKRIENVSTGSASAARPLSAAYSTRSHAPLRGYAQGAQGKSSSSSSSWACGFAGVARRSTRPHWAESGGSDAVSVLAGAKRTAIGPGRRDLQPAGTRARLVSKAPDAEELAVARGGITREVDDLDARQHPRQPGGVHTARSAAGRSGRSGTSAEGQSGAHGSPTSTRPHGARARARTSRTGEARRQWHHATAARPGCWSR